MTRGPGVWSSAILHGLRTDASAVGLVIAGGHLLCASRWAFDAGRVLIPLDGFRCWSSETLGPVGELTVTRGDGCAGLWVAGWWTVDGADLQMCVVGLELWADGRRLATEDPTAIAALGATERAHPGVRGTRV